MEILHFDPDIPASHVRNAKIKQRVELMTSRACQIVGILSYLDASALEPAESILESLAKMLHGVDSLVAIADKKTRFPAQSLLAAEAFLKMFQRGLENVLSQLPFFDTSHGNSELVVPNRAVRKKAVEVKAVIELIMTKAGILRGLLNEFAKERAAEGYEDQDLVELDHVEHLLDSFVHNIEDAFEYVFAVANAKIAGDRSPRKRP